MRIYVNVLGKTLLDISTENTKKTETVVEPDRPSVGGTSHFGFSQHRDPFRAGGRP